MNYHLIDMEVHGDHRGKLVSLEGMKSVPFEIKRVYYMFDTLPNEARGFHAHKNLEQIIIAMDGSCKFVLDDGSRFYNDFLYQTLINKYCEQDLLKDKELMGNARN